MNDVPRRHWFRFTLRTWFVLFTAICIWFGYQVNWIRQRHEFMSKMPTDNFYYEEDSSNPVQAPGMLWLFGETGNTVSISNLQKATQTRIKYTYFFPKQESRQFTNGPIRIIDAPASISSV